MGLSSIRKPISVVLLGSILCILARSFASAQNYQSIGSSLVVQQAPEGISMLSFTRHGKFVVTRNLLDIVQVWNSSNGQQLRLLEPFVGAMTTAGDEQRMFTFVKGEVREINLLYPHQSQVIFTYDAEKTTIAVAAMDPSDHLVAFGSYKGTIRVLDLWRKTLIVVRTTPEAPRNLLFSSSGSELIVEDRVGDIRVINLTSGNMTLTRTDNRPLVMGGLVPYGNTTLSLRKYRSDGWMLWDVNKRKVFRRIGCECNTVRLSRDGSSLAWIENKGQENSAIRVSALDGGKSDQHFSFPYADELGLSYDGSQVAVASIKGKLAIWRGVSGPMTIGQGGRVDYSRLVGFALGRNLIDVNDETMHIWSIREADLKVALHVGTALTALSTSGRYVAIFAGKIMVLDLATSQLETYQMSFRGSDQTVDDIAVSNDGKSVAWLQDDDGEIGLNLAGSHDSTAQKLCTGTFSTARFAFSSDSRSLGLFCHTSVIGRDTPGNLKIVNVPSRSADVDISTSMDVSYLRFAPDGTLCLVSGKTLHLLTPPLLTPERAYELSETPSAMAISPDSSYFAVALGKFVELRSLKDFQLVRKLTIDEGEVTELAFGPNNLLAGGGWDGAVRLWNFQSGKFLGKVIGFSDRDWLAISENGNFDGTARAMGWVGWHIDGTDELLPLDALFADFFSPGILYGIMSGSGDSLEIGSRYAQPGPVLVPDSNAPIGEVVHDHPPTIGLRIPGLAALVAERKASIQHPNGNVVLCLRVPPTAFFPYYLDGQFNAWTGNVPPPDGVLADCPYPRVLPAEPEMSSILVDKTPWDREQRVLPQSSLFLVTIAIDNYAEGSGYEPLHSSLRSSKALVEAFSKLGPMPGGLLPFVEDRLWDTDATRKGILDEFESLAKRVHESDTVVIYFSGHGSVPAGQDMFYFIPIDGKGGSVSALRDTAISTAQLAEGFRAIPAKRLVIIFDACQSGAVLDSLSKVVDIKAVEEEALGTSDGGADSKSKHGVGIYLIASATPFNSTEMTIDRASDLASALIRALRTTSAADGLVWVRSVLQRTEDELSTTISSSTSPVVRKVGFDFPLGSAVRKVH